MKRERRNITLLIAFLILAAFGISFSNGVFGIAVNRVEQNARKSHKVNEAWAVAESTNDKLYAMIFYNDTLDQHIFSSYVNRSGFSFGYFFRWGGLLSVDGVHKYIYDNGGAAIFSMNKDGISKIEIDNGVDIAKIGVDPAKPFVFATETGCGIITLYDKNGNVVPITAESNA